MGHSNVSTRFPNHFGLFLAATAVKTAAQRLCMKRIFPFLPIFAVAALLFFAPSLAFSQPSPYQQAAPAQPGLALSWEQVKAKFEAANPALRANALGVDEMKAAEITAFLR